MAFVPPDLEVLTRKLRAGEPESPEDALTRFTVELEFVQALANPLYLGCETVALAPQAVLVVHRATLADLASSTLLDDPALVAYLEYLQYWKRPEYASRLL